MLKMEEGCGYTPTLVCVCGENGAIMCGDTRMVTVEDGKAVFLDDCRKVFQVNDGLLFGACGMFPVDAMLVEPLAGKISERMNVDSVIKEAESYMLDRMSVGLLRECGYVAAGKDRRGRSSIGWVRYSEEDDAIHTDKKIYEDHDLVGVYLPPAAASDEEKWQERLRELLEEDSGETLEAKLHRYIRELSSISFFVGDNVIYREIRA